MNTLFLGRMRIVVACLCMALPSGVLGATPDEVAQAASTGLPELLSKIPVGAWGDYGFADADEVSRASLGNPMSVGTITPTALEGYRAGDSLQEILSETTLWYIPVQVEDSVRAVLVVDRVDGTWQAVSLGYVPLAGPLGAMLAQWSPSKGYHPKLVMVLQAQQYLFTIPEWGDDNLTLLQGANRTGTEFKAGPSRVTGIAETVSVLRPIVARNLAGQMGGAERP